MRFTRWAGLLAMGTVGVGIALAATQATSVKSLWAQEARHVEKESVMSERGKVKSLLKNDHEDVDGLLLESGLRIHFPPHLGRRITDLVDVGDAVEVEGRNHVTPRGEQVFEITRLTCGDQSIQIDRPRPKPAPKGPRDEEPMHAAGKVAELARNPHGDVDGLVLEDGTEVKFPPHQSRSLQELVAVGDQVTVDGRKHVTPHGDVHLHADRIEAKGQTLERQGPEHGPTGPKHGPQGPKQGPAGPAHGPRAAEEDGPTNADLLRELKAIRQLLEDQARRR